MEDLECSQQNAKHLLDRIGRILSSVPCNDAIDQLADLRNLQSSHKKASTVIGVIGATGAGKSSLLNALIDADAILPTSGEGACTAAITRVSYNDGNFNYRAEFEFISSKEWHDELKIALGDLQDNNHQGTLSSDQSSIVSKAKAKIKAVYPHLDTRSLSPAFLGELTGHENVRMADIFKAANTHLDNHLLHENSIDRCVGHAIISLLGTTQLVESDDINMFKEEVQKYVGSKSQEDTGREAQQTTVGSAEERMGINKSCLQHSKDHELWPLIKMVRLYIKSPILASGLVLVDLPGSQDRNAARDEIAQNYLKECTSILVAAPIKRAADDKTAQSLLGQQFKRQIGLDGNLGNLVFVCTATDDIRIDESQMTAALRSQVQPVDQKLRGLEAERNSHLKRYRDLVAELADQMKEQKAVREHCKEWKQLKEDAEDGQVVHRPAPTTPVSGDKRKRGSAKITPIRKRTTGRMVLTDFDEEDELLSDSSEEMGHEPVTPNAKCTGAILTLQNIQHEIDQAKIRVKAIGEQCTVLRKEKKELKQMIKNVEVEHEDQLGNLRSLHILARNQRVKHTVRQHFAMEIKAYDQETAYASDPDNFNPEVDSRNYGEIAENLAVFCVSSRAYQQAQGLLPDEPFIQGFDDVEYTEIPALCRHLQKLADERHENAVEQFLNEVKIYIDALRIWADQDDSFTDSTTRQIHTAEAEAVLDLFVQATEENNSHLMADITKTIADNIFKTFRPAVKRAVSKAMSTTTGWSKPVNRADKSQGGLHWSSYRACARRGGRYRNANASYDFNDDLVQPIITQITPGWRKTFEELLPASFSAGVDSHRTAMKTLQVQISQVLLQQGMHHLRIDKCSDYVNQQEQIMVCALKDTQTFIVANQRTAHRQFDSFIATEMSQAYVDCLNETGTGSAKRMAAKVEDHVNMTKEGMFYKAAKVVKGELNSVLEQATDSLKKKVGTICDKITKMFKNVVEDHNKILDEEQKKLRKEVFEIIYETEAAGNASSQATIGRSDGDDDIDRAMDGLPADGTANDKEDDSANNPMYTSISDMQGNVEATSRADRSIESDQDQDISELHSSIEDFRNLSVDHGRSG